VTAPRTRLKVCCIASVEEARLAVSAGADALGLVGPMPSGAGVIDEELIREIALTIPPPVARFLLTSAETADEIAEAAETAAVDTVQIVRHIAPEEYPALRLRLRGRRLVQVVHVEDAAAVDLARRYAPLADALLLDSGRPRAATPEFGGTGRVHDWRISREIVAAVGKPVFLAGGIKPHNVADAIAAVRPYAVDVCSGVRVDNRLNAARLAALVAAIRRAG
jgi:phosphoribosylanthranilate isomerase